MINAKLRYKMILSVLLLVLMVSLSITAVVSVLVSRQSKAAVYTGLEKSLTAVKDGLVENQTTFMETMGQTLGINKVGADVKFLNSFKKSGLNMTRQSYTKIEKAITNIALLDDLYAVRVYGMDGELLNFFQKQPDGKLISGFQYAGNFHHRIFQKGEAYDRVPLTESTGIKGVTLSSFYGKERIDQKSAAIEVADTLLGIEIHLPLFVNSYNKVTQKSEPRQIGFVIAISQLDQAFVSKMNQISGLGMNLFVGNQRSNGDYTAYTQIDLSQVPDKKDTPWSLGEQKLYFSDIRLENKTQFQALLPFYAKGQRIGGLLILQSDAIVKRNTRQIVTMIGLVALACIILVTPLAWFATGKVVTPLIKIVDKLKDIAEGEGDLTTRLEVTSKDEIGQVAQWFNTFIDKINGLIREVAQTADELNHSSGPLAQISKIMSQGAEQTSSQADSVSAASEEMSVSMNAVASAMEQTSGNMGMVAAATEEMTSTINEISTNTMTAKQITDQVVNKTQTASEQIAELGSAANAIGQVVEVITDISDQVNLLALNATIEAARAGEAGKGFAVVANEIKDLARQTADATNQIKEKVGNIHTSTNRTVDQINEVSEVVGKVSEIVVVIASAVEEQSASTQNIAENIVQVTQGVDQINTSIAQSSTVSAEIAKDIGGVTQNAGEMTQNSIQVDTRSKELSNLAKKLITLVEKFKI